MNLHGRSSEGGPKSDNNNKWTNGKYMTINCNIVIIVQSMGNKN